MNKAGLRDLVEILACPRCKGGLQPHDRVITQDQRLKSAILCCPCCHDVVGVVRNFKFDFLHFDRAAAGERTRAKSTSGEDCTILDGTRDEIIAYDDARIEKLGEWFQWDDKYLLSHGILGDTLEYRGEFLDLGVRLLSHPYSGIAIFEIDGRVVREVDLYQRDWSTIRWFSIANDLSPGLHTVRIIASGRWNDKALGAQLLLHEIVCTRAGDAAQEDVPDEEQNRVLPVCPAALDLIKRASPDGWILDCGGGDRSLPYPRYINLDYTEYQLPTVYGNALELPFRSDSMDLVISQAVLEHVPDPFAAVREMGRVAKPGGVVWAGMAFMQPVHAVPAHYFNATVEGVLELFKDFEIEDVTWFGDLSFTVDWLFKTARIPQRMDSAEYEELIQRIQKVDALVSYEDLRGVASGVAVQARKRDGSGPSVAGIPHVSANASSPGTVTSLCELIKKGDPRAAQIAAELLDALPAPSKEADDATARTISDLAFALEAVGDIESTIARFQRVLAYPVLQRNIHAGAWYRIGLHSERLSLWRQAMDAYTQALAQGSDWPHMLGLARLHLAELLVAAEEYQEAHGHYQLLRGQLPHPDIQSERVTLGVARTSLRLGLSDEALAVARSLTGPHASSQYSLDAERIVVEIYEARKDHSAAVQCHHRIMNHPHADDHVRIAASQRIAALTKAH